MSYVDGYSNLCYGYMGFWRPVLPTCDGGADGFEVETWPYFRARYRAEGISKRRLARNVGRTSALTAESAYRRVLPVGALHNLARGLHGDHGALARAGAILAGPAFTATGFLMVRWTRPAGPPQEAGSTLRIFVAEPGLPLVIDGSSPPVAIDVRRGEQPPDAGPRYLRCRHLAPRQAVR